MGTLNRTVGLICPTCGNDQFQYSDTQEEATCADCGLTLRREELIEANGIRIEEAVKEMGADAIKEAVSKLRKSMKGSRWILK